jgi:hypothetical protein
VQRARERQHAGEVRLYAAAQAELLARKQHGHGVVAHGATHQNHVACLYPVYA